MTDEVTAKQSRVFAGYQLLRRVNVSATSELYRARHPSLSESKRFLVKRYASKSATLAHAIGRRCMKLRTVTHPTLPPLLDHGVVSGFPYVAREYISGIDLQRLMQRLSKRDLGLPPEQLVAVVSAILDGLDLAHLASRKESGAALTHGDVSPSHIMLQIDGSPRLIGFETPRGHVTQLPSPAALDISVPSAIIYSYLQAPPPDPGPEDPALQQRRRRLREAVEPIVSRGLDLDAKRAYQTPGELRDALHSCLDFAGFLHAPSELSATLEALAESARGADDSGVTEGAAQRDETVRSPRPARQRSDARRPLHPGLDVGYPDSGPIASPPLPGEELSSGLHALPEIPAPIDFGASEASGGEQMAHPLPAFEVGDGDEELLADTAAQFEEQFHEIIDRFDEVSAEHSFDELSNPFGFEPYTDQRSVEAERSRSVQRIGNVLVDLGFVRSEDVRRALERQGRGGVRLGEYLVMEGAITEPQLVQALAMLHDARPLQADEVEALQTDAQVIRLLPSTFVAAHRIVPISVDRALGTARVLVVDPSDVQALTEARVLLDTQQLQLLVSTRDAIDELIGRISPPGVRAEVSSVKATVLVVDPDDTRRRPFAHRLRAERFVVEEVTTTARARRVLDSALPSALIVCADDPEDGLELLRTFCARPATRGAYAALACGDLNAFLERAEALQIDLVSLPIRVDYVVAKIRRSLVERREVVPPVPEEGVRGSLGDMNLLELTQTLRLGRKSATVAVRSKEISGEYRMRDGNVVHARAGEARGEQAFFSLCQVTAGEFQVSYGEGEEVRRNVFDSTEALLIETARRSWFSDEDGGSI